MSITFKKPVNQPSEGFDPGNLVGEQPEVDPELPSDCKTITEGTILQDDPGFLLLGEEIISSLASGRRTWSHGGF